jgi:hypothetical protein
MDIKEITNWANQNQGLLAIILFLVSLMIGWISGFFKWVLGKFKKDNVPYIKAGGDILIGNKTFIQKSGDNSQNIQGENINLNKYGDDK